MLKERVPDEIPDLPDDPERNGVRDDFVNAFLDACRWEREGERDRSARVLLAQLIGVAVDTPSLKRLTARLRHFLNNEVVRRDFEKSLGVEEGGPMAKAIPVSGGGA